MSVIWIPYCIRFDTNSLIIVFLIFQKKKSNVVKAQENIVIRTDLNLPLKNVRSKLEKNFNCDLSDYTMWLQVTYSGILIPN